MLKPGKKVAIHNSEIFLMQILEQVSPNPDDIQCSSALTYPERNRGNKFLPGMYTMVCSCRL